jgi:hypothetical protein
MEELYSEETGSLARYSIPLHDDHYRASSSVSKNFLRPIIYQNSTDDHTNTQTSKFLEINEDNKPSSNDIEKLYDGLNSLDETRLDEMIETDLLSSSNG